MENDNWTKSGSHLVGYCGKNLNMGGFKLNTDGCIRVRNVIDHPVNALIMNYKCSTG